MSFNNRFYFTGYLSLPRENAKRGFITEKETKSKKKALSLNVGIKESDHNIAFVEMFGFESDEVLTLDTNNAKLSIPWADRFDPDYIAQVANYKKYIVDFSTDENPDNRKEFISEYDAIAYIKDHVNEILNKKIRIIGQLVIEPYNGKYFTKYKAQKFIVVDEDAENHLYVTTDLYYNKESIDKADWNRDHTITLNAYTPQYINKDEQTKFVPFNCVLNCQQIDLNDKSQVAKAKYLSSFLNVTKHNYVHIVWDSHVINGAEEIEVTYDMLSDTQKQAIDCGIKKLEDFKKPTFGDRVNEFRLTAPKVEMDEFEAGFVEVDMTPSEFEELIYIPAVDEKAKDILDNSVKEEVKNNTVDNYKVDEQELNEERQENDNFNDFQKLFG